MVTKKEHDWERNKEGDPKPSLRCKKCNKLWLPDQTLKQQGECNA